MIAAGWIGYRFAGNPRWIHATIFSIAATAGVILSAVSTWVYSRFDSILTDTEKRGDPVRVEGVTTYIAAARKELLVFLIVGALAWLTAAAMALLLFRSTPPLVRPWVDRVSAIGYACVACIASYAIRVGRLYLSLDKFRLALFAAMDGEKKRLETLRSLNPAGIAPLSKTSGAVSERRHSPV